MEVVIDDNSLKEGESVIVQIRTANEKEWREVFRYT